MIERTAKEMGVSVAELVRRAVQAYCGRPTSFPYAVSIVSGFFGSKRLAPRRAFPPPHTLWARHTRSRTALDGSRGALDGSRAEPDGSRGAVERSRGERDGARQAIKGSPREGYHGSLPA